MTPLIVLVAAAAGGGGALIRWLLQVAFGPARALMAVGIANLVGSFVAGLAMGVADTEVRTILIAGFCGGLTTFSTFAVESVQTARGDDTRRPAPWVALAYVVGSITVGALVCWCGLLIAQG